MSKSWRINQTADTPRSPIAAVVAVAFFYVYMRITEDALHGLPAGIGWLAGRLTSHAQFALLWSRKILSNTILARYHALIRGAIN